MWAGGVVTEANFRTSWGIRESFNLLKKRTCLASGQGGKTGKKKLVKTAATGGVMDTGARGGKLGVRSQKGEALEYALAKVPGNPSSRKNSNSPSRIGLGTPEWALEK